MRIGLLTTSFPRFEGDIAGTFVLGFARALVAQGHTLEVLAPEPGEVGTPLSAPGIKVLWVPYLRPRALERTFYGAGVPDNLARHPWSALGLAPFTLALFEAARRKARHWDAVVSHWALPCALVAGELGRSRHLAVLHSADIALLERLPLRRALASRILRRADALVFASRNLRRRFQSLLAPMERAERAGDLHVCAMGIDALSPESHESREVLRQRLDLRAFTLLSLGRLVPIKGLDHAIRAVAQRSEVELVIAGAGPLRAELEAQARAVGARVRFVGEVRGAEKQGWLRAVDALVLPSVELTSGRSEGMPTVLLEAMQHGLPVIASDTGGVRDVVRHEENGLLVPPGEARALAGAIERLQREPGLHARLAEAARDTASLYDWDTLGPHFSGLLE